MDQPRMGSQNGVQSGIRQTKAVVDIVEVDGKEDFIETAFRQKPGLGASSVHAAVTAGAAMSDLQEVGIAGSLAIRSLKA